MQNTNQLDSRTRWSIFWLLIICSLAVICGRIWQVQAESHGKEVPFLSANDRSRWCTIRSLGDYDTYAIDSVLQAEDGKSWDTIDKVKHWGKDGKFHSYSSKPPLHPTALTYVYLGLKKFTPLTLKNSPFDVVRWMLVICQVLPLIAFFWAVGRTTEMVAESEWTRMFIMGSAAFGTYITTFAVSLNNHLPAVVGTALAVYALVTIWTDESDHWGWFALAGISTAVAAACELPALSFLAAAMVLCSFKSVGKTLLAFVPPVALVAWAFFAANITAHQDWQPAYAHRSDGPVLAVVDGIKESDLKNSVVSPELKDALTKIREDLNQNETAFDNVTVVKGRWPKDDGFSLKQLGGLITGSPTVEKSNDRWLVYFDEKSEPAVLAKREDGFGFEIRKWNNWYEFPGSYWLQDDEQKSRVDRGEKKRAYYLAMLTIGHHGVFSLTPIWFLSIFGLVALCESKQYRLRLVGYAILAVSVVVIAFYVLVRPTHDLNYGGVSCAPRWLFWLAPMWFLAMIPALDAISESRTLRGIALILLLISIGSAVYGWANPWVNPWPYEVFGF